VLSCAGDQAKHCSRCPCSTPALVLQAVGGVEKLERELQGQGVELRQVAEWLQAMQASSTAITAHLVQVSMQLDHLQGTVEQRFDDVDTTLQAVLAYMATQAAPGRQKQQQPRPVFVIPRSEIRFSEADLAQAAGGAFGKVVKAARDQGYVAVKIYRHRGLGNRDRKRVVQEALLLARASHQNVVRCFGVVHDPDRPNDPDNIDGSLVMEWVYGGDLYQWLQANENSSFRERLTLATQVGLLGRGGVVAMGMDIHAGRMLLHKEGIRWRLVVVLGRKTNARVIQQPSLHRIAVPQDRYKVCIHHCAAIDSNTGLHRAPLHCMVSTRTPATTTAAHVLRACECGVCHIAATLALLQAPRAVPFVGASSENHKGQHV
jgi:hypothetical protein